MKIQEMLKGNYSTRKKRWNIKPVLYYKNDTP